MSELTKDEIECPRRFWVRNGSVNAVDRKTWRDEIDSCKSHPGWVGTAITFSEELGSRDGLKVIEESAYTKLVQEYGSLCGDLEILRKERDELQDKMNLLKTYTKEASILTEIQLRQELYDLKNAADENSPMGWRIKYNRLREKLSQTEKELAKIKFKTRNKTED